MFRRLFSVIRRSLQFGGTPNTTSAGITSPGVATHVGTVRTLLTINRLGLPIPLIAALLAPPPPSLHAQTPPRIDASQPTCKGCTLSFTRIATLGSVDDPVFPGVGSRATGLTMNSKGQFFSTSLPSDQVVVYDRTGKFLRTIGRKGNGPGEFQKATYVVTDPHDTLYVLDIGRISVYSPTFTYVRTITAPTAMSQDVVPLPNKSVLVNHGLHYKGSPLKLTSNEGSLRFFARDTTVPGPCFACTLVLGQGNTTDRLWSTWNTQFELQQWTASGQLLRTVPVVNSTWHRVTEIQLQAGRDVPPPPVVLAMAEDARHQLWVLGELPSPDWTPYRSQPAPNTPRGMSTKPIGAVFPGPETLKRLTTVVDVFDVTGNRLLLSQRFDHRKLRMIGPGYFAEVREDKDDVPVWDVYRVELRRP